jgi:hypothetical protein
LELVDELRHRRQSHVRLVGQVGEPDAVDADVPPDLEVREADLGEQLVLFRVVEQIDAEVVLEACEQLPDREPIVRELGVDRAIARQYSSVTEASATEGSRRG